MIEPSDFLKAGRRAACQVEQFELLEDFCWHDGERKWLLRFRLDMGRDVHEHIPASTNWYALLSDNYPYGGIDIFPDKEKGITATFPHQSYNHEGGIRIPWRSGLICVNTPGNIWGRAEWRTEPFNPEGRLVWHIHRAINWLEAAGAGKLQSDGDPFELPPFPRYEQQLLAFNEDAASFQLWQNCPARSGLVELRLLPSNTEVRVCHTFSSGKEEITTAWGTHIEKSSKTEYGIWIQLPTIPVLAPWQIPEAWNELIDICGQFQIDLKSQVKRLLLKYAANSPKTLMIGFPISKTIGQNPDSIHWFAIKLESYPRQKGFGTPDGYITHVVNVLMAIGKKIPWIRTQNWHKSQISARGTVHQKLQNANIVMIGAGAVGSELAESLLRLGCGKMTIVDPDAVEVGNLCRHTLTMNSVGHNKAVAVAGKLNCIFPFATVAHYEKSIQQLMSWRPEILNEADIIIETTGDDDVLSTLGTVSSDSNKNIISVSTNLNAERLYCFISNRAAPPESVNAFFNKVKPYLERDREELKFLVLPLEYVGCWHPLSPARLDDLTMLIHSVIRPLETAVDSNDTDLLIIAEKIKDQNGNYSGIQIKYE